MKIRVKQPRTKTIVIGEIIPTTSNYILNIPLPFSDPHFVLIARADADSCVTPSKPSAGPVTLGMAVWTKAYRAAGPGRATIFYTNAVGAKGFNCGNGDGNTYRIEGDHIRLHTGSSNRPFVAGVTYKYWILA